MAKSSKKKTSALLIPLLGFLVLAFYMRSMTLPLVLDGGTVKITALMYSNMASALEVEKEVKKFGCQHYLCVGNVLKQVIAGEFRLHSGKNLAVEVDFVPPRGGGLMEIQQPQSQRDGLVLMHQFWREFRDRDQSFFKSDVRLLINIVKKSSRDYSERSLGSAAGRVGFVEWDTQARRNSYMWNVTKVLHELGHVFGAADQYLPGGGSKFPGGYIDKTVSRRDPQKYIAIMSGRRPNASGIKGEASKPEELKFSEESARLMGWRP